MKIKDLDKILFVSSGDRITDLKWFLINRHGWDKNKVNTMSDYQVETAMKYESEKEDRIAENEWEIQIEKDKKGYRNHSY